MLNLFQHLIEQILKRVQDDETLIYIRAGKFGMTI